MVSDISGLTDLVTDVHLMITEPIRYVEEFVRCGADIVTFHVEAAQNVAQTIAAIKKAGAKAGLALKPATPVDAVAPFIDGLDMILVMSVEPGFGGQSFMPCALDKIRLARKLAGTRQHKEYRLTAVYRKKTRLPRCRRGRTVLLRAARCSSRTIWRKQ